MKKVTIIILLFIGSCISARAQNNVGTVIGITGTASLTDLDGKLIHLNTRNFVIAIRSGQIAHANGKGTLKIKLCNGRVETIKSSPYRIPQVVCPASSNLEKRRVLDDEFDFGGRYKTRRGDDDFLLFPSESEITVVRPATAAIRWKSTDAKRLLCSIYLIGIDKPVWTREVNGNLGYITSPDLKAAIEKTRREHPEAKLKLTIKVPAFGTENSSEFRIFSLAEERSLQNNLAAIGREPGIARILARANLYAQYGLYGEMAAEFERALRLSPESIDLLNATASAFDRAGNFRRRDQLDERLKKITN